MGISSVAVLVEWGWAAPGAVKGGMVRDESGRRKPRSAPDAGPAR